MRNSSYGLCGRKATLNSSTPELKSCVKVEVAVLGPLSLIVPTVSVDVKQHCTKQEFGSCVKVEVDVLGPLSLTVLTVSVDVKRH